MHNSLALARRVLQQFKHDPRTVVLLIVAPILVLWLLSAILGSPDYHPKLAAVDLPAPMVQSLDQQANVVELSAADASDQLSSGDIDAVITMNGTTVQVTVEGSNPGHSQSSLVAIQKAMSAMMTSQAPAGQAVPELSVDYLHGSASWGVFDYFGPVFVGVFVFFFVFITSGMSLVTERSGGTMERLLVTPIKAWQLVAGYCFGFGVAAVAQSLLVLWASTTLLHFPNEGSAWLVILITFSMALVSMTLGLLVSALAKTAFQVIQLLIVFVVPQILLSGVFDLTTAPTWMRVLSVCFPITHGAEALRAVMLRGAGFTGVALQIGILWAFIAGFFALATLSFARRQTR